MSIRPLSTVRCVWRYLSLHHTHTNPTCQRTTSIIKSAFNNHINIQRNFTTTATSTTTTNSPSPTAPTTDSSSQAQAAAAHAAASSINQTIQQTPISQTPQTPVNLNLPPTQAPKPGFLISDAAVFLSDGTQETINDLLKSKRCLLLGFVGAFTRLDQQSFVAYAHKAAELKKKYGIDHVYALSVNDHSVLSAFKDSLSLQSYTGVTLIADFDARMTRWLGMEIDLSSVGFGVRSKRFAMLVDKQQVKVVRVESNVGLLDVTSLESMTQVLKEMKKEEAERLKVQLEREAAEQSAAVAAAAAAAQAQAQVEAATVTPAAPVTSENIPTSTSEASTQTVEPVETQTIEPITTESAEQQPEVAPVETPSSNSSNEQTATSEPKPAEASTSPQ